MKNMRNLTTEGARATHGCTAATHHWEIGLTGSTAREREDTSTFTCSRGVMNKHLAINPAVGGPPTARGLSLSSYGKRTGKELRVVERWGSQVFSGSKGRNVPGTRGWLRRPIAPLTTTYPPRPPTWHPLPSNMGRLNATKPYRRHLVQAADEPRDGLVAWNSSSAKKLLLVSLGTLT